MVAWDIFFIAFWESDEEWFWTFEPFAKLKATFCKYWTSIKIKIAMTCVYKEYEVKVKWYRSKDASWKWRFYWVIAYKLLFSGEMNLWMGGAGFSK